MIPYPCQMCHSICDQRTMIPCTRCGVLLCPACAKEGGLCRDCLEHEELQQSL